MRIVPLLFANRFLLPPSRRLLSQSGFVGKALVLGRFQGERVPFVYFIRVASNIETV